MEKLTALVTGASSGIGVEFARLLAKMGHDLVLVSRGTEKLNQLKLELEKEYKIKAEVVPSDLSKDGAAEILYKECNKKTLKIDILINNAGVGLFGESVRSDPKDIMDMLHLNMLSLTELSNLFAHDMIERHQGYILNVGSMVGLFPTPYFGSYAASKSYVYNYSLSLKAELADQGVSVTCLLPGFVKTNFDHNAKITQSKYKGFSESNAMLPRKVAKIGLSAMFRKKAAIIPGIRNKITAFFISLFPHYLVAWIARKLIAGLAK